MPHGISHSHGMCTACEKTLLLESQAKSTPLKPLFETYIKPSSHFLSSRNYFILPFPQFVDSQILMAKQLKVAPCSFLNCQEFSVS